MRLYLWARRVVALFCVVTLLASNPGSIRSQGEPPGLETLKILQETNVPARNRAELARRLLRMTTIPTPQPVVTAYVVGDTHEFRIANLDDGTRATVQARLWYKTPHLYIWFEAGFKPDMAAVKRNADNFEAHVYPTVHAYFGSESLPDISGDVHLYILHAHHLGQGVAAYFDTDSEYPKTIAPDSNEHHMIFVNLDTMAVGIGTSGYEGVLAHEFQHMVHATSDPNESSWLDEGMAELAAALTGYREESAFVGLFAAAPDTQLNTWSTIGSSAAHYGASYLFVTYFLQRFGEQALLTLNKNPLSDLEGVADTLRRIKAVDSVTGKPVSVENLFADWVITNLVNDAKLEDGRFAYTRLPSKLPAFAIAGNLTGNASQTGQVTQWGTTYLKLTQSGHYTLTFEGDPTVRVVPVAPHSGTRFWWSNRGDQIDTRLTHRFDLRNVQKATLNFWLWYAIEENWDYGYVQVSADDGQTWTALASQDSVPAGGDNNPYGPGYTGQTSGWRQERVDLSAYAGRDILVRFEYLTDAALNDFGMALDDISIPEIGYSTDAESGDEGWVAEGWARIENILPQRYLLQMITPGAVTRLIDSAGGGRGPWTIDVSPGQPVLLALSGLTEFTTETARYTLTLAH
jgi:hypothetical protein